MKHDANSCYSKLALFLSCCLRFFNSQLKVPCLNKTKTLWSTYVPQYNFTSLCPNILIVFHSGKWNFFLSWLKDKSRERPLSSESPLL